jgi:hypothetical protein
VSGGMALFHGHQAVAPLKPDGDVRSCRGGALFHGHQAVAPLKLRGDDDAIVALPDLFHGHQAVAPLSESRKRERPECLHREMLRPLCCACLGVAGLIDPSRPAMVVSHDLVEPRPGDRPGRDD